MMNTDGPDALCVNVNTRIQDITLKLKLNTMTIQVFFHKIKSNFK